MAHGGEVGIGVPGGSLRQLVAGLQWKSLFLFCLLLVVCALPFRLSVFVHEMGHIVEMEASGGHVYGIEMPVIPYVWRTSTPVASEGENPTSRSWIFTGILAQILAALLICGLTFLARPASAWRPVGTVFGGLGVIVCFWYPVYGYYGNYGDLSGFREALKPWGDYVWLVFPAGCFVVGFFIGKLYMPLQEAFLPSGSRMERILKTLVAVGVPYVLFALLLALGRKPLPVLAAALPTGLGGLLAIWRAAPPRASASRFKLRLYVVPLVAALAFESYLFANDGVIRFEKRKYDAASPLQFKDGGLARMLDPEGQVSFDFGPDGKLYMTRTRENILCTYDVETGASETLLSGLANPFRVRCRNGKVYVAEHGIYMSDDDKLLTPETGRRPGRIVSYDPKAGTTRVICDNLICLCGLDVDSSGDVYFTEQGKTICVVRDGQTEKTVLRDGLDLAISLALSPAGDTYIGTFPHWRYAEDGALYRFSKNSRSCETVATGISTPLDLRCDSKGNLYIGGGGYSSITMMPKGPTRQLVTLRGGYFVVCLAISSRGDVYYATDEGDHQRLHVLRRVRSPETP